MNKKLVGILLCMLLLATAVPVTVAMQAEKETNDSNDGIFGRTVVRGFIFGSRTEGKVTSFFALRVHYTTYTIFGEADSGVLMFQKVSFMGKLTGHLGRFYVSGTFRGTP